MKGAARPVAFFQDDRGMSSEFQYSCCLHTCHAGADDENLFLYTCGLQIIVCLSSAGRVHCAGNRFGGDKPVHTALMASETGADKLESAASDFIYRVRVSQKTSAQGDQVGFAIPQGFGSQVRIFHASGNEDGDIHFFFQNFAEGKVHSLFKIHRRMGPVPGIIGSGIHIQCIVACFDQNLGSFDTFRDITAEFFKFFAGKATLAHAFYVGF